MQYIGNRAWANWLIRFLVLIAMGLVVFSFTHPWWIGDFGNGRFIWIYGWGLRDNLNELASYVQKDVTPQWQVNLAWVYVGLSTAITFFATWFKRIWGGFLMVLIGIGLIAYPILAIYKVIVLRLSVFGIILEGPSIIGGVNMYSSLTHSYYLTWIGGGMLIMAGLIRVIMTNSRSLRESNESACNQKSE